MGEYSGERLAVTGTGKSQRWWIRRAFVSLALFFAAGVVLFFALPGVLIAPAKTAQADVILHDAIDPHSSADDYVMSLYRQGIAAKIVCLSSQISWEEYPADYARQHLISLGARAEDVVSLHLPLAPCNALKIPTIVEFVKSQGWKRVLLIGRPEDSRYTAWLAGRFFEPEGIALTVSYAPEDKVELTRAWWRTHWKVQRLTGEAMNISLDVFYSECR